MKATNNTIKKLQEYVRLQDGKLKGERERYLEESLHTTAKGVLGEEIVVRGKREHSCP